MSKNDVEQTGLTSPADAMELSMDELEEVNGTWGGGGFSCFSCWDSGWSGGWGGGWGSCWGGGWGGGWVSCWGGGWGSCSNFWW
jgi:hypothetical protein